MKKLPVVTEAVDKGVSMALVIDVLRASRELYYFSKVLYLQDDTDRHQLAHLLTQIGGMVKTLYGSLVDGHLPMNLTLRLEQLGYELDYRLEPVLGRMRAQTLADKFNQSHRVRLLHRELESGMLDVRELVLLDEAANHLLETANRLRAEAL
ncbi:MAG: hypothetical protein JNJ65_02800 [Cyclobacteriaceae bacterium]|nr:hypothetical protein [Cyclobacteriaceae bacterium]